jgi:hypothetical protein
MSIATPATSASTTETETEDQKAARLKLEKLEAVAANLGARVWGRTITTDAGLTAALIVGKQKADVNDVSVLLIATAAWIRQEHADDLASLHYTEALRKILRY